MSDHLVFSKGMKKAPEHDGVAQTFLGQAHIAGTGPEGRTCRECAFWHHWTRVVDEQTKIIDYVPRKVGYYSAKHPERPLELKKGHCNRPILNKAVRLVPHYAQACRLFEPCEQPQPIMKEQAE